MKQLPFLLFLAQCLAITLPAQPTDRPGFLYGVMPPSGSHVSFLFGTLHHLDGNYLLKEHPTLLQLSTGAEVMVCESDPQAAKEYHGRDWTSNSTGTSLKDLLSAADFRYVSEEFFKATGQPIEPYLHVFPIVLRSIIKQARALNRPADQIEYQIVPDLLFQHVARQKSIPLLGLETAQQSLNAQLSIPLKDQAFLLVEGLNDAKIDSIIAEMNTCYKAQDLNCFCKIMDLEHCTYPGDEQMLKGRNRIWMEKLPDILRQKRAFVFVGAGHLCGPHGLPALLQKEGFLVVPMEYK
ncbi:MAG TPA: TraB/GumN family protein [Bacteroidetes bacterium]|nr:TraB/GumN family protein [Bacteroidota bacterium]